MFEIAVKVGVSKASISLPPSAAAIWGLSRSATNHPRVRECHAGICARSLRYRLDQRGGNPLGTQALVGGVASFSLNPLPAGDHILIVNYGGDHDFEASSEAVIQSVGAPALSIHGTRVVEGNRGVTNVSLAISLSTAVAETVRVSFSTSPGTATAGGDYESASGVIEFAPGELSHAIELHGFGDTKPEPDETFSRRLSYPCKA